jgi:hypothetical protein
MSTKVSEGPIYTDWENVKVGGKVSIIEKQYTKFDAKNFKTYSTDDTKFKDGTLKSMKIIPGGYGREGNNAEYKVELDSGEGIIAFEKSPSKYLFKVVENKSSGGKKSRRKRNSKKSRKNRRKSNRRHN